MAAGSEEILFADFDESWGRPLPVTLITYPDGTQDLHRQTGSQFDVSIEKARALLLERELEVLKAEFIGPPGAYMPVRRIERAEPPPEDVSAFEGTRWTSLNL